MGAPLYVSSIQDKINKILDNITDEETDMIDPELLNQKHLDEISESKEMSLYFAELFADDYPDLAIQFINESDDVILYNRLAFYNEINSEVNESGLGDKMNRTKKDKLRKLLTYSMKAEMFDEAQQYFRELSGINFGEEDVVDVSDPVAMAIELARLMRLMKHTY